MRGWRTDDRSFNARLWQLCVRPANFVRAHDGYLVNAEKKNDVQPVYIPRHLPTLLRGASEGGLGDMYQYHVDLQPPI